MTYAEALEKLKKRGQEQLLRHYEDLSDAEKAHLLSDIESIDFSVFDRAEHFAKKEYRITPIPIFTAEMAEKTRKSCETAGISAIRAGKVAAVLLSGGQGTRLGFAHAKGMFDIGITRAHYIFEFHFAYLLSVAKRSGAFFPVYVMTSAMNGAEIRAFLEEHDFFDYDGRFVHFYAQSLVASTDTAGKILMSSPSAIVKSPDGNGGWFSSMEKTGVLDEIRAAGVEWLNVVSIDNVMQKTCDPAFVGATILSEKACGAKVIRKTSFEEKIGLICENMGHPAVIEYYELDGLQKQQNISFDGMNFGVILNYLFRVDEMEKTLSRPLPVHKALKKIPYFDGEYHRPERENGYKYEMLATDLVEYMSSCLPYEVLRAHEFAPIKNRVGTDSVESAQKMLLDSGFAL